MRILHETLPFSALKRLSRITFAKSYDFGLILGLETLYTSEISESDPEKTKTRNYCYFPSQIYEITWEIITKVFQKPLEGLQKSKYRAPRCMRAIKKANGTLHGNAFSEFCNPSSAGRRFLGLGGSEPAGWVDLRV